MAPEQVAAAILRRLSDPSRHRFDVLEAFGD
jgi:hypothetical protein